MASERVCGSFGRGLDIQIMLEKNHKAFGDVRQSESGG